jgi:hypothetical protein
MLPKVIAILCRKSVWGLKKMQNYATDFETYSQIKWELHRPIQDEGIDFETLKRLYESKLAYLEKLRVRCFSAMNLDNASPFQMQDYEYILIAIQTTKDHLRDLIRTASTLSFTTTMYDKMDKI